MRRLFLLGLCILLVQHSVAPPLKDKKEEKDDKPVEEHDDSKALEYHRYLKEVVDLLESDAEFREKLQKAEEADVRSGKIAHELEYVNHHVRTKLDEVKRREIERLRHLATKEYELENGLDIEHLKVSEHLDHENPHSFEIDDLKKLIAQSTKDLSEIDRKRREEFKEYEMQKKFEQEQKLKGNELDEEARKKYEAEVNQMKEKHKKHEPLHHPGSKQQLEEVWEKQDHMDSQDFDPKTFFYLHDLDGNGVWDQNEVKALFRKELDKLYAEGHPEDDLLERAEEMERMREHVFVEADLNKDGLISFQEFLQQTKRPDFQQDGGWQTLDEQQIYSQQEYEEFEKHRQAEVQKMIDKGMLPPHHNVHGHPQQFPQHASPQGLPQQQFAPHPNQQVPYHGQPVQQQYQPIVQQQYQPVPNQQYPPPVPQQQYQPQVPQQQYQAQPQYQGQPQYQAQLQQQAQQQYQAPPPQQAQQQYQPPPQQAQYQVPPQQVPPQQVPPQQVPPQQVPPQQVPPQQVPPQQVPPQQVPPQQVPPQQVPQQVPPQQAQPQLQLETQAQLSNSQNLQQQNQQQIPPQGQAPQQNQPLSVAPNSVPIAIKA